jgi:hypothetical protein
MKSYDLHLFTSCMFVSSPRLKYKKLWRKLNFGVQTRQLRLELNSLPPPPPKRPAFVMKRTHLPRPFLHLALRKTRIGLKIRVLFFCTTSASNISRSDKCLADYGRNTRRKLTKLN